MLRDDAVAIAQAILGFRTDQAANLVTFFQFAQNQLEKGVPKPWFLMSEDSVVKTTIGDNRIEVPADFLAECEGFPIRYRPNDFPTDDEVDLWKDDYYLLKRNFAPSTIQPGSQQIPQAYARRGNYFHIFPVPDQNYNIRLIYYAKDLALTTNFENNWLKFYPDLIIGKAGKLLAAGLRDAGARGVFEAMERETYANMVRVNIEQEMTGRFPTMGGPVRGQGATGMLPPGVNPLEIDDGN